MSPLVRRAQVAWEMARALLPMAFIELSLRASNLPRMCHRLGLALDLDSGAPPATEPVVLAGRTRQAVRGVLIVASHWPAGDTCLRRCLLLGHRLRRLGPVLRIGVERASDGAFVAHSWLELNGTTFDPSAADFAVLGSVGR
ncbi:lasso peptide biosynthesis B2 protein [Pseudonocardia sp. Cha107L01]|uniref:lasso peptide biosynthesis B2 protein n=1 Tax=Pseudonocardia sp. Cha107L01 TaxID=3457576 RepID=UPI00403EF3EE